MCGILGALLADPSANVIFDLYEGLCMLQHRGQDAAGIITNGAKGRLYQCKGNGMVRDVFEESQLLRLLGNAGVGHVRYPTAGTASQSEAQPFYVNSPYGIVLAHNGNLTNAKQLRTMLDVDSHRHINTDSDSELLLNVFADHLNQAGKVRVNEDDVFNALTGTMSQVRGGYACTAMIAGFGIIGFRDPNGIRPICVGKRLSKQGLDYMFASESVVLTSLGFTDIVDVAPGEAYIITKTSCIRRQCMKPATVAPCIFEYVYFARPDSIMNGISIYKSRLAMGEALAARVKQAFGENMDIDVVIPVPDTSRVAALQLSYKLGIVYREGFMKNRYIGRTFIMPGQQLRKKSVRRKLNPMPMEFQGKNVLLVDDSVVRGTTSKEIVQMARDSGAKKVYFASCSPPIRYPNVYGIDMPTSSELVAFNRSEDQVAEVIGADCLIYQNLQDLIDSCRKFNPGVDTFDVSVFSGQYVTNDVDAEYLTALEMSRHDPGAVITQAESGTVTPADSSSPDLGSNYESIGLHNSYHARRQTSG